MSREASGYLGSEGFVVRRLVPEDLPAVLHVEQRGQSYPWSDSMFRDCLGASYHNYVLLDADRVAGFAIWNDLYDEVHLMNICVHPDCRGRGVGRYLLRQGLADAMRRAMASALLEVRESNEAAIALYRSESFTEVGRRKNYYPAAGDRETAIVMTLRFT